MVKQVINVGANANDGTGDDLRTAMQKVNSNFTELFGATAEANDLVEDITPQLGGNLDLQSYIINTSLTNGNISLQPNGTGSVLLKNIRITDNVISSDDSTSITINESLVVTGSATVPTINTNTIQSDDSTVISINDSVKVSGNLEVQGDLKVNTIGIDDSTPLTIASDVFLDGNMTVANTITTNTVAADAVYTEAVEIVQNKISARRSNDDLVLSPSGTGSISASNSKIKNVAVPTHTNDAATKGWVEGYVIAGSFSNNMTFVGDDSTGTSVTLGETFKFAGASNINTSVSGDTLTITGPDLSNYVQKTDKVITMVGDDSTGVDLNVGETIKIAGTSNITTAVSGDTLTITGPNLSSYLTNSPINVVGDDSTGTTLNTGETIKIAGGNNITTAVSGDTVTVTGSTNINVNSISSTDSSEIQINDSISVAGNATINGNISATGTISGSLAFSNLTGKPTTIAGYGITDAVSTSTTAITVVGDDSTGTNFTVGETLKVTGSSGIAAAVSGDTLTISLVAPGSVGTIGDLIVTGQTISGGTNGDISIVPQGVGNINLDADRIRVGDLNSDVTISSNGAADLILKTDVDNPSVAGMGSITIGDGVDGVITIRTSDNGYVSLGNTTWDSLSTSGSRNKHGLAVTSDIDRNLSSVNLERYHASSIGAKFNLLGTDPDNGNTVPYRAHQIELINNLLSKNLISKGWITFDPTSKNATIESIDSGGQLRSYAGGPVALGVQNNFRNGNSGNASVEETANISSFTGFYHTVTQNTINVNNLHGIQQSFDLAVGGGDTVVDNIRSYVATGNYFTNGSATANNYYAFWAGQPSEATNNWGVYIESADWENYLGGLTIVDSTIRADRSNENIYLETAGAGKVIVNDTLNVNTVELNEISSADSSAIQINDAVNVSGTLSVENIDTNTISSGDSSAIQVNDDLNISGSLTVHGTLTATAIIETSLVTNEISSADSSAIQINDGVNISGTLNAKTIVTNDLISQDSSVINILDGLNVSGVLTANTISTTSINSSSNVTSENLTLTGLLTLGNRTVAQLSILTPAIGTMAYCTNETGGAVPVFYDGASWRRMTDRNIIS